MPDPTEQIKALQYIFDVARTAPAPAAVHEQTTKYAKYLAQSFNPAADGAVPVAKNPVVPAEPEPASVAEAVAKATEPQGGPPEA